MKKILLLDFDGVLHADGDALFSKLDSLEKYLLNMPNVDIVISSSWRESYFFDELKKFFPVNLQGRIIGITPTSNGSFERGGRQREIEAFLDAAALNESNSSWIALDDMGYLFDHECSYLILVNPELGFCERDGQQLMAWYESGE